MKKVMKTRMLKMKKMMRYELRYMSMEFDGVEFAEFFSDYNLIANGMCLS